MKKVTCIIAISVFAIYLPACSGTKNSTTSPKSGMQTPGTSGTMENSSTPSTTNPSGNSTTKDSSQRR